LILTLTVNPAIDRTISVDRLAFDDRAYIEGSIDSPGGRGINASRVLECFGVASTAIVVAGGETGARFETLVKALGFQTEVVRVRGNSRTNFTISDERGLTIKLNERGAPLEPAEVQQLMRVVESRLAKAHYLMLCGSLPPGVSPHFYAEVITAARAAQVPTLLDTDGDALRFGIEAQPTVVKPNHQEAERLLRRPLLSRTQWADAVREIQSMGAESVLLSLGARGAVAAHATEAWEAVPPPLDAVCPIGAGDALAAAFVWASRRQRPFADSVRWAVAAGSASALLSGMNFATLEQAKAMYQRIEMRPIVR
jgi:1-phosphofructokinase family hexose kinase